MCEKVATAAYGPQRGAVRGLFVFNLGATIFFAWVATATAFRGFVLWPVVILHAVITIALVPQIWNTAFRPKEAEILLDHRLGKGLSTPPDKLKRKSVLSPRGQKGFLRVGRKWMIRLGRKSDNMLVCQVKVLHH